VLQTMEARVSTRRFCNFHREEQFTHPDFTHSYAPAENGRIFYAYLRKSARSKVVSNSEILCKSESPDKQFVAEVSIQRYC